VGEPVGRLCGALERNARFLFFFNKVANLWQGRTLPLFILLYFAKKIGLDKRKKSKTCITLHADGRAGDIC